ncbi:MAG: glycosyltransferase family 2 protein, partial [Candidatus Marinimicrobia bacterium]|nr:glycosyltransferase family 2 protein [Candidatus Neomarinimicrobiota bacterium]
MNILVISGEQTHELADYGNTFPESRIDIVNSADLSAKSLSEKLLSFQGDMLLLIDARSEKIEFKQSAAELYELVAETSDDWSLIYADYEVDAEGQLSEEHLLDHHIGRVRDNTDYGKAWVINLEKLSEVLPLADSTNQHFLYEIRLRLSEVGELVHIANRYAGAPYRINKAVGEQNVFDYLLASKESQLELEQIVSDHLKRIGAYLAPGEHYSRVPYAQKQYDLVASVIIPVNNRPGFIGAAIESILAQTIQNIEVIVVVNGGENDPTIAAVQEYM